MNAASKKQSDRQVRVLLFTAQKTNSNSPTKTIFSKYSRQERFLVKQNPDGHLTLSRGIQITSRLIIVTAKNRLMTGGCKE